MHRKEGDHRTQSLRGQSQRTASYQFYSLYSLYTPSYIMVAAVGLFRIIPEVKSHIIIKKLIQVPETRRPRAQI